MVKTGAVTWDHLFCETHVAQTIYGESWGYYLRSFIM